MGDFRGFDGPFDEPPILVTDAKAGGGDESQDRHRLRARSGNEAFRLVGDVFGWAAIPLGPAEGRPSREASRSDRALRGVAGRPDLPEGVTSRVDGPDFLAFTLENSFRVRVWTPVREPV